jgi:precorrin-6A/cobalt-precorrin-6A reductase
VPEAGEDPAPILVLGGTLEGRRLAEALSEQGRAVITSLAGATRSPGPLPGEIRRGGFGGTDGLARFLRERRVAAVVDATHPFAVRISAQSLAAAADAGVPLLRLERPAWTPATGDRWHEARDLRNALPILAAFGSRVLVAAGRRIAGELPEDPRFRWLVRSIERPDELPASALWIEARPPFRVEDELRLLEALEVEALLVKASGGHGSRAKLDAARSMGLPVVLLRRPAPPGGVPRVGSVDEALEWLAHLTSELSGIRG